MTVNDTNFKPPALKIGQMFQNLKMGKGAYKQHAFRMQNFVLTGS
jgi:hypothetical protein